MKMPAADDIRALAALRERLLKMEPLVPGAARAVPGEGAPHAAIVFVGEQPGDQEDRAGRPFVGPAGKLLDRALAEAGIRREDVYLTNAVKHFKFVQRGKKRIHQRPTIGEVKHYRWWLEMELSLVHPRVVVALGATAVLALAGKAIPVMRSRGKAEFRGRRGYITMHPSYLLRLTDAAAREAAYRAFIADLRRIKTLAAEAPARIAG
jgi:uracil-DNA glycosylase family protein